MAEKKGILKKIFNMAFWLEAILARNSNFELFVLLLLARRIKQIGRTGKPLDAKEQEKDLREIAKKLHVLEVLQKADMNRMLEELVNDAYLSSKIYYDYRNIDFSPLEENKPLIEALNEFKEDVYEDDTYQTQAFMLRDPKNRDKLIPTPISEAYEEVIHRAAEQVQTGQGDYTSAIRQTIEDLADSGMQTVEYDTPSGKPYHQSTEAAVKRNIQDNVRDLSQKVQDEVGKQFGSDGKEITVHEHSAPDHEDIQGHQFSNEEFEKMQNQEDFEDYNGKKYKAIKRAIGTLNCKHFVYSIILGLSIPAYTDDQLEENIKRNQEGYTDPNGKHYTLYDCEQEMRRLERLIRNAKKGQMMALEADDIELARRYQMKVDRYTQKYKDFCEACGLSVKGENLYVPGYKKIKV